jgi:hypothetical protein
MGRAQGRQSERLVQTREAIGVVSDLGGAAVALSMLAAGLVGVTSLVIGLANGRPGVVFFGGGVVLGVVLGTSLMRAARLRHASSVETQRGYRWVEAVYTYRIDAHDRHQHAQAVDVTIRALRDGVDVFSNQYRWSGSGDDNNPPIVQSSGHALHGLPQRSLGWRFYLVSLSPPLYKGEEATISVLQKLWDGDERHEPFLAKAVHETMGRLVLRVQLPPGIVPERIWRVAREGAGPEAPEVERAQVVAADNGLSAAIEWMIPEPVIGLNYELSWEYGNHTNLYGTDDPGPKSHQ